jgi:uncharacterized repeat protein (TIGR03803 family)
MKLADPSLVSACILAICLAPFRVEGGITLTTLVSFNGTNGANPSAGLVQGQDGNFYGTAVKGGANSNGVIFRMSPSGNIAVLASFAWTNGASPISEMLQGRDGNLYGTAYAGGAGSYGTVFMMPTNGQLTTLASFMGTNGIYPEGRLIQGPDGSFYGTTLLGGANSDGTAFKLSTNGVLSLLSSFDSAGASPFAGLVQGSNGNFFGTTYQGGTNDSGTIFVITPGGALTNLHYFPGGNGGGNPYADLILGRDGCFYGTTYFGGASGFGTIFKVSYDGVITTLFSFGKTNGAYPQARLLLGLDGALYGTTSDGGAFTNEVGSGYGTVFKLTTNGVLTTLVSFNNTNGAYPKGGLVQDSAGNLYGTTPNGGASGKGTVFRLNLGIATAPVFKTLTQTGNSLALTWTATPGRTYQLQYRTNLNQISWANIGGGIIASNPTITVWDAIGPDLKRFYRVALLP